MTYEEAKALRDLSVEGGEVDTKKLQRALYILSQPKPARKRASPAVRKQRETGNPWNLSEREVAAMDAVIKQGRAKTAARAMGISHRTIEVYHCRARKKMGVSSLVSAAVLWDRYIRSLEVK